MISPARRTFFHDRGSIHTGAPRAVAQDERLARRDAFLGSEAPPVERREPEKE
jgi:hypothetical protein